jgi:hypothetical protein
MLQDQRPADPGGGRWLARMAASIPAADMDFSVSCECYVRSGRCLCDGPIPRPEESYRVCVCVCVRVIECDQAQK